MVLRSISDRSFKRTAIPFLFFFMGFLLSVSPSWADDFDEYDKIPTRVDDIRPTMKHFEEAEEEEREKIEKKEEKKKEKGTEEKEDEEDEEEEEEGACQPVCVNGFFGLLQNRHSVFENYAELI